MILAKAQSCYGYKASHLINVSYHAAPFKMGGRSKILEKHLLGRVRKYIDFRGRGQFFQREGGRGCQRTFWENEKDA